MKKYAALVLALVLILGCTVTAHANMGWFDFNYDFKWATIRLSDNHVIVGVCEKWWDFDDSDTVQVQIDGNVYLTHYSNVVLSKDKPAW